MCVRSKTAGEDYFMMQPTLGSRTRGVARWWSGWPKPPPIPAKKIIRQKQHILFTTFTLHIKLHSSHLHAQKLKILIRREKSEGPSVIIRRYLYYLTRGGGRRGGRQAGRPEPGSPPGRFPAPTGLLNVDI